MSSSNWRSSRAALVLIVAVGAALRFWGLRFGFPHPYARTDEEVLVDAALYVLGDGHPRFFDWPTFFINLTAGAYAVVFAVERTIGGAVTHATIAKASFEPLLHLVPRVMSAVLGTLTVPVIYLAARDLFSRRVALLSAGALAVAYLHVRDSHFGVTDVPATFFLACAFWAAVQCATRGPSVARVALAGVLLGLATTTKYNAAIVGLPIAVAMAFPLEPRRDGAAAVVRSFAIVGACALAAFFAGSPFAAIDWPAFTSSIEAVRRHLGGGHVVGQRGWLYHATFTLPYGLGLPMWAMAVAGAIWMAARERWRVAALALSFPVAYYLVVGSGLTVFTRYMTPMVPLLCLAAGYAVDRSLARVVDRRLSPYRVIVAALCIAVAWPALAASVSFDRLMARPDTRALGARWLEEQYAEGATIYQNGLGVGFLIPQPRTRYTEAQFNPETRTFIVHGQPAIELPDVIVLLESPLFAYSQVPREVRAIVDERYALMARLEGVGPEGAPGARYDLEDAFFAPYAGFSGVENPGPRVSIFARRPGD